MSTSRCLLLPAQHLDLEAPFTAQLLDGGDALRVGPRLGRTLHVGDPGVPEREQVVDRLAQSVS